MEQLKFFLDVCEYLIFRVFVLLSLVLSTVYLLKLQLGFWQAFRKASGTESSSCNEEAMK